MCLLDHASPKASGPPSPDSPNPGDGSVALGEEMNWDGQWGGRRKLESLSRCRNAAYESLKASLSAFD